MPSAKWYAANREHASQYSRETQIALRLGALRAYGLVCALCPEARLGALTIDHINQDGSGHRRQIGKNGSSTFRWLKQNEYPDGFRTLCANCNVLIYLASEALKPRSSYKRSQEMRRRRQRLKDRVMNLLGSECVVCGITDIRLLTTHHPAGDGAEHRRTISNGRGGYFFYEALLRARDELAKVECRCFSCNDAAEWSLDDASVQLLVSHV